MAALVTPAWSASARTWAGLAVVVAAWLLMHGYSGIDYDARIYILQGLAHLHPDSVGGDVFLRFNSQERYTLFSPVYASAIALVGPENAARLLTALGHAWWMIAASLLALSVLPRDRALLAVGLLFAIPVFYSAWSVLRVAEGYLTPRLYAECLSLTALCLAQRGRWSWAVAFQAAAFLVHPLMAMSGALLLAVIGAGRRGIPLVAGAVVTGTAAAVLIARFTPVGPLTPMPPEWLALISTRTGIVTPASWDLSYWSRLISAGAVLWLARAHASSPQLRDLAGAGLTVAALGVAVSVIGGWLSPVALLASGQAWRWTWLPIVLATLCLADAVPNAWRKSDGNRAVILLLAAAALAGPPADLALAILAGALLVTGPLIRGRAARSLLIGAAALTALAAWLWLARSVATLSALNRNLGVPGHSPGELVGVWLQDGVFAAFTIIILLRLVQRAGAIGSATIAGLALTVAAAVAVPAWSQSRYDRSSYEAFGAWRDVIPRDAEVFWGLDPTLVWILLERRSFVSADQTAGAVFSRAATDAMHQRARSINALLPGDLVFLGVNRIWIPDERSVRLGCAGAPDLDYVITNRDVGLPVAAPPVTIARSRADNLPETLYLYGCATLRGVRSDTPK